MYDENDIIKEVYPLLRQKKSVLFTLAQSLVKPSFNTDIPTARVSFNTSDLDKNIAFEFNPVFWEKLNVNEKMFVFIHEILHVLFYHGSRGKTFMDSLPEEDRNYNLLNIAMDICINELIIREYLDAPLSSLPSLSDSMCTIKNCFPDSYTSILEKQNFAYYYDKLLEESPSIQGFDIHLFIESPSTEIDDLLDDIISDIKEIFENDTIKPSTGYSSQDTSNSQVKEVKKLTPEKRIEYYLDYYLAETFGGKEPKPKLKTKWYGINRRNSTFSQRTGMNLPIREVLPQKKGKYLLVAYCDVSGSVKTHSYRMLNLISSIDESKYEVEMYAWATRVSSVQKKSCGNISYSYPGGGTNIFSIFEHYEKTYSSAKKKPNGVIVLTDGGYQDIVYNTDAYLKTWFFFMINNNKNYPSICKSVNIFS